MPWWVTAIILIREIGVTILRFVVIKREVISANRGGKLKSFLQNFSVGFYILPLPTYLYLPRDILLGIAIALTVWTGIEYFRNALVKK
jgi:CDP-diacylglycerol--glycerol-3-phosphate 3-phosphatidyltransferase